MEQPSKYLNDKPHPGDTFIAIICFAILIFFAAPDLVRWLYGMAP